MKKVLFCILALSVSAFAVSSKVVAKATAHSTSLTWNASTGSSCNGSIVYNVYTGATAGGENYTTPLNSSPLSSTGYVDTAVVPLQTKFYTVKASCTTSSAGSQSGPSNEAGPCVTPGDPVPPPPTGVTATSN